MYISSNQMMVIHQENAGFLQQVIRRNAEENGAENRTINYANLIYRCGVRRNHHVLVIGGENVELLQKLGKTVGWRGQITVLDNRDWVRSTLNAQAKEGYFKAYKPYLGGHPAFDERAHHSKFVPVRFKVEPLEAGRLPFDDNHFDMLWIETLPQGLAEAQFDQMICEFERVSKN